MLVLTRKLDERIMIGPDVVITVVGIRNKSVRIAIEAPRHIVVDREEVHRGKQRVRKENLDAQGDAAQ